MAFFLFVEPDVAKEVGGLSEPFPFSLAGKDDWTQRVSEENSVRMSD